MSKIMDIQTGRFQGYLLGKPTPVFSDKEWVSKSSISPEELWKHVQETLVELFGKTKHEDDFFRRSLESLDILKQKLKGSVKIEGVALDEVAKEMVGGILDGLETEIRKDWQSEDSDEGEVYEQIGEDDLRQRLVDEFIDEISDSYPNIRDTGVDLSTFKKLLAVWICSTQSPVDIRNVTAVESAFVQVLDSATNFAGAITDAKGRTKREIMTELKVRFGKFYKDFSRRYAVELRQEGKIVKFSDYVKKPRR
jgi:hypothetical protein